MSMLASQTPSNCTNMKMIILCVPYLKVVKLELSLKKHILCVTVWKQPKRLLPFLAELTCSAKSNCERRINDRHNTFFVLA
mmetsp:Transcript_6132/g.8558  ORF Transcript_6132/g.8558 Transcript_6132/m.8558 type:complete len:81 (+) Transcript_6132:171-413(+)